MLRPRLRAVSGSHATPAVSVSRLLSRQEPGGELLSFDSSLELAKHRGGRSVVQDWQAGLARHFLYLDQETNGDVARHQDRNRERAVKQLWVTLTPGLHRRRGWPVARILPWREQCGAHLGLRRFA